MQLLAGTPNFLWTEAINLASFLANCSSATANGNTTPYQRFIGRIPTLGYIRIYGSKVYTYTKDKSTGKWDPQATTGVLIGIDDHTKGYCCWIPSQRKF
jgi:hypothetical protein